MSRQHENFSLLILCSIANVNFDKSGINEQLLDSNSTTLFFRLYTEEIKHFYKYFNKKLLFTWFFHQPNLKLLNLSRAILTITFCTPHTRIWPPSEPNLLIFVTWALFLSSAAIVKENQWVWLNKRFIICNFLNQYFLVVLWKNGYG